MLYSVKTLSLHSEKDVMQAQTIILPLLILLACAPAGYLLMLLVRRPQQPKRSLLLVSTDETARQLIVGAARQAGYGTIVVYRYEDALEKLNQDMTLRMIMIDDSVPQYEAGLLISMLRGSPIGVRPLILIHDSSELGQTAPSYRAAAVVSRPLTQHQLEEAIRQVDEQIAVLDF
jgi:CheY-like chemotaxis protein